jgi:hypothetical protein
MRNRHHRQQHVEESFFDLQCQAVKLERPFLARGDSRASRLGKARLALPKMESSPLQLS